MWLDGEGNPVPPTQWQRSAGSLGGQLLFTADPQGLFERWEKLTDGVYMMETNSVARLGELCTQYLGREPQPRSIGE